MSEQGPPALALVMTVVMVMLAGCSQQGEWHLQSLDTASEGTAGAILVTDAAFVYDGPVKGGTVYEVGDTVPLHATIVNRGSADDRLLSVRSPIAADVEVQGTSTLPARQVLAAGYSDPIASLAVGDATRIDIKLTDLRRPVRSGLTYPVVFTFARGGTLRLRLAVENPAIARGECPLPPVGMPPRKLTAPYDSTAAEDRAPKPDGPPVPGCSSLVEEPEVEVLDVQSALTHVVWAPKHKALLALAESPEGKRLVRIDPLTGKIERSREVEGAGENFDLISYPVERVALPLTDSERVAVLDVESLEEVRSLDSGTAPSWVAVHNSSRSLFVLSEDGSTVTGTDYEHADRLFRERVDAGKRAILEPGNRQKEPAFWLVTPGGYTYYSGTRPEPGPTSEVPLGELRFSSGKQETPTAYYVADNPSRVLRDVRTATGDLAPAASNAVSAPVKHIAVEPDENRVYAVTDKKVVTMRADTLETVAVTNYRATLEDKALGGAMVTSVTVSASHLYLALEDERHLLEVKQK